MSTFAKFNDKERVLCYHDDSLYEASILMTRWQEEEGAWVYGVHYKGWSVR